jgi:predicted lipoprotein
MPVRTRWIIGALGLAVFTWLVPLFHVVSLQDTRQEQSAAAFNAADFVEKFWRGPLAEAAQDAVDAGQLLAALREDFAGAKKRYGHRLGLSGSSSFLVSGRGQIIAVDNTAVSIALQAGGPAEVRIEIGPVFGNAVRDGSGLLNVSDFANAQEFNALSAEINRRVEEQVLPLLQGQAVIGASIRFAGGVEVSDASGTPSVLALIPVVVEFP